MLLRKLAALGVLVPALGFQPAEPVPIGPGVTRPVLTRKMEPTYSEAARQARVQGTVVLEIVVGETGLPEDIAVISPLGFGLDEIAASTVSQWLFKPGMKDGKPVRILATVEVNFRLTNSGPEPRNEKERTAFNVALREIKTGHVTPKVIESVQKMSREKYPPGMYLYATLLKSGNGVPVDASQALALMQESAAKGYPEAMFDEGQMLVTGNQLPKDLQKGLDLLRRSANLGSWPAQYLLGSIYERGGEVDKDLERSRRYFRLCAATGEHLCQERLGASLVRQAGRQEREYVQGVAWLELAAEQGDADAEALMAKERPGLTLELISRIEKLKPQLVRKN